MSNSLDIARQTIRNEIEALDAMMGRLDGNFEKAIDIIVEARGRVIVAGMGKSGIIGQKIAATLASTGTPSFFVHPGEAFHGDLGMIKPIDVVLLISNSGETEEVIRLLPFMQHQENRIIAMTGKASSTLGRNAHVVLDVFVEREACNNNLAPTSSTTATLVMGDALAIALADRRNFRPEDFARFHPGGSLGRKLLTRVSDVMHKEALPVCSPDASFRAIVNEIGQGRLGLVLVMDGDALRGIITDGDVRRAFDRFEDITAITADMIMTRTPKTVAPDKRFAEAEQEMLDQKINSLVVTGADDRVLGVLQIYDVNRKF
ncbi:KpsF/GutQ family sugar-phosphate isomerase [Rhizobiaceae bacterium BDR2-2]|uniref:KpsF/GutQ family sugar-phosphate isomerase n=1 Tax=Ectorhizobium quercum TaxID=2965071 RepID=A0AAE3MYZ2_9HYPH|nr:KpsF/GutQ family sugar-phosphate isomerase [Ectorhizobium quercum]MCX8996942.1 KpsF/GutQ family sugar-phosphate isomerase [Ectorhizobium quercum]